MNLPAKARQTVPSRVQEDSYAIEQIKLMPQPLSFQFPETRATTAEAYMPQQEKPPEGEAAHCMKNSPHMAQLESKPRAMQACTAINQQTNK